MFKQLAKINLRGVFVMLEFVIEIVNSREFVKKNSFV